MFRAHPERAARLLSNIPRLEMVAEIIRGQQSPQSNPGSEESERGTQLLHLAMELDRRIYRGDTPRSALAELKRSSPIRGPHAGCARRLFSRTSGVRSAAASDSRASRRHGSRRDFLSTDGNLLILKRGTILTETWIERLENFAKARVTGTVDVRVPRLASPRKFEEFVYGSTETAQDD